MTASDDRDIIKTASGFVLGSTSLNTTFNDVSFAHISKCKQTRQPIHCVLSLELAVMTTLVMIHCSSKVYFGKTGMMLNLLNSAQKTLQKQTGLHECDDDDGLITGIRQLRNHQT